MYYKTYSNGNYENFWESIFITCELFRIAGHRVSKELQYKYNEAEDKNMTKYINQIKELPKDAKEIIL
jgi:aminoglycoside 6-adenylyltransferase